MMKGEEGVPMIPWFRGFRGSVVKTGDSKWQAVGVAKKINSTTIEISELPIRRWTEKFKAELEEMIANNTGVKVNSLIRRSVYC